MSPQQIAVLIAAGALGLLVVLLLMYGRPRRTEQEPLPANFHKGDPDAVLEGPRLMKLQVWGVATSLFMAGFLAFYFVAEPFRQQSKTESLLHASIERGEFVYSPADANCASCHGPSGEGGFSATNPEWPAPPLNNILQRYSENEVRRIIKTGRAGTPMPVWGIEYGGPLHDMAVEDVLNYVISFQVTSEEAPELDSEVTDGAQVYAQKCAVCHGDDARGRPMGRPMPTFYAPDLTTAFTRLGLGVLREQEQVPADFDPATVSQAQILEAGEEAVRATITGGRPNTPMPAWANRILPEQIDAVIEYLRTLQRQPS